MMQDVNYQLFTESVWDEISIVCDDDSIKESVLRRLGLFEKKDFHPQSLSGGEKQRLLIGLCKASPKPIVVLDEPTSGLCKKNMSHLQRDPGRRTGADEHHRQPDPRLGRDRGNRRPAGRFPAGALGRLNAGRMLPMA